MTVDDENLPDSVAALDRMLSTLAAAAAAVLPALQAAAEALNRAAAATREHYVLAPPAPRRPSRTERRHGRARPAWQSPYGPRARRH